MTSLYDQSIPILIKYLQNLAGLLKKAEEFADKKGMKHEEILQSRLIADMQGLVYQVQTCTNTCRFITERIGGLPTQSLQLGDDETTFSELQDRISRTVDLLKGLDPKSMEGKEYVEVLVETQKMGNFRFNTAQRYVSEYAIPNFHFHLTTAYCILRHMGVEIGAMDYMKDVFERA